MKYLSVFSGIEAATVAWEPLGFKAVGYSEIEPFPSAVLKHHFPHTKNYGDITKFREWNIPDGTVDILVGGSPCQAFSVAGLRKGLSDPRGNLALTFLALADKIKPKWIVWENVPGVLSSNDGRDFASLIGALAELRYGYAWRCLDAQYFGVPQRRKRIFLVATSTGKSTLAAEVLSLREGLLWNSEESNQQGQEVAIATRESLEGNNLNQQFAFGGNNTSGPINVATCLSSSSSPSGRMDFASETFITEPKHVVIDRAAFNQGKNALYKPNIKESDIMDTLVSKGPHAVGIVQFSEYRLRGTFTKHKVCSTLKASTKSGDTEPLVLHEEPTSMAVRRLTPKECERLQGFPDDWTKIPWKNKPAEKCPDGLRYHACGNSMAVPVMSWIGKQILKHNGSL